MRFITAIFFVLVALKLPNLQAAPAISLSETNLFGDLDCFRIQTPHATYLYGKRGAGFASIIDSQGNDWIAYRHGGLARGEYHGLPKCGQPTKFFHCGYGFGQYTNTNWFTSTVTLREPNHVRIHSETRNADSGCDWDFFAERATLTLLRIGAPAYWFLYEGVPGGKLDPEEDFVVRPGNRKTFLNEPWSDNVPWVYFGAGESRSAFFLIQHQKHGKNDSYVYWPYKREADGGYQQMTVFGFGRPDWQNPKQHTPPLTKLPARFSIGFAEGTDYDSVSKLIEGIQERVENSQPSK
ncbi:MAG TPA: hypothetical protein VGR78_03300 [Verrucomicrobiae bacterium]|jgi:hypothetical protein|nr:hypothetical protein [Verrucomicrobiae bacterium]